MVKFTLKQCMYFLAVAETGGIAQAARILNISQPAVAQAVGKLEQVTGLTLFHRRHARGLALTAKGREFHKYAQRLIDEAEGVAREIASIAADLSGTIRLGCFHAVAPFYLARLVKGYRAIYPDVQINAAEQRQNELLSGLETGATDLAIMYDMALDGAALEWRELVRLRPYIILPRSHPFADRSTISLQEMGAEPFVLFDGPGSREYFRTTLASHGIDPPISFRSSSLESVRSAVGNGLGFSLSVMRVDRKDTYDGHHVVPVRIAEDIEPIGIVLAWKRGRDLSQLILNFKDHCAAVFKQT
ncbi:MAG: LysR family transcriptional regulator [Fimbriimonadaceae bacterium]|nr:LysR family transcriptional regulator [Alphaproteobacteria bacterium]